MQFLREASTPAARVEVFTQPRPFGRGAKIPVVVRSLSAKSRSRQGLFVARSAPTRILWQVRPEISRSPLLLPEYGGRSSAPNQGLPGSLDLATNLPTAKRQKSRALP